MDSASIHHFGDYFVTLAELDAAVMGGRLS